MIIDLIYEEQEIMLINTHIYFKALKKRLRFVKFVLFHL